MGIAHFQKNRPYWGRIGKKMVSLWVATLSPDTPLRSMLRNQMYIDMVKLQLTLNDLIVKNTYDITKVLSGFHKEKKLKDLLNDRFTFSQQFRKTVNDQKALTFTF